MTEHSTSRASSKKHRDGYRPNVGIVLSNHRFQVFWARRSGHDGWQFPQGGIEPNETAEQAVFRELYEEIGLKPHQVRMIGRTRDWLRYDLPRHYTSRRRTSIKGQKQIWFLFQILCDDSDVQLDATGRPEFDDWKWVDYWQPLEDIVEFKRQVYEQALAELQGLVFPPWLIRR